MKPVDLTRKLRHEAAFEPAALNRGKEALMAAIRQEVEPTRRPTIIPQLPYADIRAALVFLQRGGIESQYISVAVADVFEHYQRALAAGARIAKEPREHAGGHGSYEVFDPEGHRWRFVHQRRREVPAEA